MRTFLPGRAAYGAVLAVTGACAPPPPLPRPIEAFARAENVVRQPIDGPERPTVFSSFAIDYPTLPLAATRPSGRAGRFEVGSMIEAFHLALDEDLLAEVEVDSHRAFTAVPPGRKWMGADRTIPCGFGGVHPARWQGIRRSEWTAQRAAYEMYEGTYDRNQCKGKATSFEHVVAEAVVPNALYAFRRETTADAEDLVIIGPSANWITSTTSAEEQTRPHAGTFSHVALPMRRGSSAAAFLVVDGSDLREFFAVQGGTTPAWAHEPLAEGESVAFTVEVAWPSTAGAPEIIGFVSIVPDANKNGASP